LRKRIVIALWISLVVLIIAFCSLIVYQNKQKAAEEAEAARIEAQKEKEAKEAAEEAEAQQATDETEVEEYTFTDFDATYFATSDAVVLAEPYDSAEEIGTLSTDARVSIVGICNETDYYKMKINGDYGYISFDNVSEEYIDIPIPSNNSGIPTATKDILFIGNSITVYPTSDDWWGNFWGCGASTINNDYVHLTVAAKGYTSYDAMSLRAWEFSNTRNYELDDLDPYISNYQYSTIVIELGENVKNHETHFKEDFEDMITYIRSYNPNARIVILDNFWKYSSIISTKKEVASEMGCTYVSLADIQEVPEYQLQEGDQFTAADGTVYTINSFLAGHPNDAGYAAIAQRLIAAL